MIYEFEYRDDDERQSIIDEHADKYLIKDSVIVDGNFLVFTDEKPIEVEMLEIRDRQEATDAAVLQLMMEGVK